MPEGEFKVKSSPTRHDPPLLFNLSEDPAEKYNVAEEHPEVITEIRQIMEEHKESIKPVENQLEK
jgi:hypothetical protein